MLQQILRLCTTGVGPYAIIGFAMLAAYMKYVRAQARKSKALKKTIMDKAADRFNAAALQSAKKPSWFFRTRVGATEEDDIL